MTNAVDILLVGGPAHGRMVCARRPVSANIDALTSGGIAVYKTEAFGRYWIARAVDLGITDEEVEAAIAYVNLQPSWDL